MGAANCAAVLLSVPISYHFHGCTALLVALVVVSGAILNTHLYLLPSRATRAHMVTLFSVSVALSQTPAEAASPRTRGQCVAWSACLAPSLRQYQFILLGEQRHTCVNNLPKVVR